ncbi:MAG: MFS transporter [Planctomycetaceae bacterium]
MSVVVSRILPEQREPKPALESASTKSAQVAAAKPFKGFSSRQNLRESTKDALFFNVMVGMGENYFSAFALTVGAGQIFAGLIATLPMLVGACFQLGSPWIVKRLGSHQKWIVWLSALQGIGVLLLPISALFSGWWAASIVFLAVTLYWGAGQAASPAWNTWIEEVIPRRVRTQYFSIRARFSQLGILSGFVLGGIALQWGKGSGYLIPAFVTIFCIAAACRLISARALARHQSRSNKRIVERTFGIQGLLQNPAARSAIQLICFLLAIQTVVQISGPYFVPYMLSDLLAHDEMKYFSFLVLMGTCFVAKMVAAPFWGRYARATSSKRLMVASAVAIVPISALWIVGDCFEHYVFSVPFHVGNAGFDWQFTGEFLFCLGVQVLSGITWAGFELAMVLMFLEAIPRTDRTSLLTIYNWGNAAAMVLGGLIGAGILHLMGQSHEAYLFLFGLSSVMRLVVAGLFLGMPTFMGKPAFLRSVPMPQRLPRDAEG